MICIPVVAATNEEALEQMAAAFSLADLVELRADAIGGVDLERLLSAREGPVIVTARRREEGGSFEGSETERIALLYDAVRLGADFIDLELGTHTILADTLREEIRNREGRTKLIVSHHDFNRTPPYRRLQGICDRCVERGADIVKVATFARSMEDNLKILRLTDWAHGRGYPVIAHCMGTKGKASRIMAPLFGSYLAFASLGEGQETAPGQLTAPEMRELFRILEDET